MEIPPEWDSIIYISLRFPGLMRNPVCHEHLKKLSLARNAFMSRVMTGDAAGALNQERVYYDFYVDVMENEAFWFSQIFSKSSVLAEWTVGILGQLATIRRQRCHIDTCLEVLELDTRVLKLYQRIVDRSDPAALDCVRGLTYKYNSIVINANSEKGNRAVALKAFREAVKYEIEEGFSEDEQNFAWMLGHGLGIDYFNMDCLRNTSDDFIWSILSTAQDYDGPMHNLNVEAWICDGCGAEEEFCGDFQMCSGCKKAKYCSRNCQVNHWKPFHKAECKSKNKNAPKFKVTGGTFKAVANVILDNYAQTVMMHVSKQVTAEHKKAAFPGLVQLFKCFLVDRPEFGASNMAFQDANCDPEFNARLQTYMEQQQGYESLVAIHKKPQVRAQVVAKVTPDKSKELIVGQDVIANYISCFVPQVASQLGFTDTQRQDLEENITAAVSKFILGRPEYNSYRGFMNLADCEDWKQELSTLMIEYCEGEGMLAG